MNPRGPLVAVCGTSQASPEEARIGSRVGELLAQRGAIVVCGGLGGVMAAAAQGVAKAGGTCLGFLPGDDPAAAPPEITVAIPTGLGELRNGLIARACVGMVAIGGGYGTLSEIGFALRIGRPIVGIHTWPVIQPGDSTPDPTFHLETDPDVAVEWLWEQIGA